MFGIDSRTNYNELMINPWFKLDKQKLWRFSLEQAKEIELKVKKLLKVGFIQ